MIDKKITICDYDASEFLDNEETIAAYLSEILATGTASEVNRALGDVARARNMSDIAKKMKVSRPSLYKSFSGDTNTEFNTVRSFLSAIGLRMQFVPVSERNITPTAKITGIRRAVVQ